MRKLTQEEFIERVNAVHGEGRYDLSRAKYTGGKDKVEVICPEHGSWRATPIHLFRGVGCPKCGVKKAKKSLTLTQEEFEKRVHKTHGSNRYDLSRARYINNHTKVEVLCPTHGSWMITPSNIMYGYGCPVCGIEKIGKIHRLTQEEFEGRARKVHGDSRYDLSRARYVNSSTKVEVVCPKHGGWMVLPPDFLRGRGCPKCGREKAASTLFLTQEEFEARVREVHGNKFDLRNARYTSSKSKVEVICPKHGSWRVTPNDLLSGCGCPECGREITGVRRRLSQEEFENRVTALFGNKADFSKSVYKGHREKVTVRCTKHDMEFEAPADSLFARQWGCPKCVPEKISERLFLTQEEFENRVLSIFGDKADLSKALYKGLREKVTMRCIIHNEEFEAPPDSLFTGAWGCPECWNNGKSKGEDEVAAFLDSLGLDLVILRNVRDVIPPKELDIYVPEKNLAVEYNGIYHHHDGKKSRNYHKDKYIACREKGIRLIQILDFAWETRQEQIKSILANALGARTNERKVDARKCEVRRVNLGDLRGFFDANHIQGHCGTGSLALALFFGDEIVAAMVFGKGTNQRGAVRKEKEAVWTLSRYATSCVVRGGFQKLLAHGRELVGWEHDIISYSANDYFNGKAYEAAGFELDAEIAPDYTVYHPRNGLRPKSHWQRRHIPARLAEIGWGGDFDPDTDPRTEWEVEDEVGAVRVWDSGKIRWRLRGVDLSHRAV